MLQTRREGQHLPKRVLPSMSACLACGWWRGSRSSDGRKRAGYIERPGAGWLQGRWYALILPLLYQTLPDLPGHLHGMPARCGRYALYGSCIYDQRYIYSYDRFVSRRLHAGAWHRRNLVRRAGGSDVTVYLCDDPIQTGKMGEN